MRSLSTVGHVQNENGFNPIRLILFAVLIFTTINGTPVEAESPPDVIQAFVSILPQAYFVERIGGDRVAVNVLVGPGMSPATYEPTPKQLSALSGAHVFFRIGTPFEDGLIRKISDSFENLKIIDTRKGITMRYFRGSGKAERADPHIWLDPKRVKIQAETIFETLSELAPEHSEQFEKNLSDFQNDLERIDAKISEILAPFAGQKFYVFHPAFGYFGESYGIRQVPIEIEGKEPNPRVLVRLIELAKQEGVKVIFVQPQYAQKNAEILAKEIGGAVVPIDPLPRDYLKQMEETARMLQRTLSSR